MNLTSQRERLIHLGSLLVAVGIATGLFYGMPDRPVARPRLRPTAPRVVYGHAGDGASSAERRAAWSPALFALPADYLGPADGLFVTNRARPIDLSFPDRIRFLDPILDPPLRSFGGSMPSLTAPALNDSSTGKPLVEAPVFATPAKPAPPAVKTELWGDLKGHNLVGPQPPTEAWARLRAPWMMKLFLRFDAEGRPAHVVLDTPSPDPAFNDDLVRRAYQYRLDPPPGRARDGWLILRGGN